MKKLLVIPLLLIILLGLSGCSSFEIGAIESNASHKMSASYYRLSGTKETKQLTVAEGETIDVSVDIVTKKGALDAYIYKDEDNYDYEGHDIPTSSFTVTLTEPGDYTIRVKADKHKGSYSFSW
ncbi:MAG: hypothetical protein PHF63_08335 [Herbinix sp.]|nr:hypothetical protein [Herbinix sp.]